MIYYHNAIIILKKFIDNFNQGEKSSTTNKNNLSLFSTTTLIKSKYKKN